MKDFTKKDIEKVKENFHNSGFDEVKVNLNGREFSYFVLPQSIEPKLLNFVYRCTGKSLKNYVFGVSDNIEEKYRKFVAFHEFIEFIELKNAQNRCINALEQELKLVPEAIKKSYLQMRKKFFEDLIIYCSNQPENYAKKDLNEFKKTLFKVKKLTNN